MFLSGSIVIGISVKDGKGYKNSYHQEKRICPILILVVVMDSEMVVVMDGVLERVGVVVVVGVGVPEMVMGMDSDGMMGPVMGPDGVMGVVRVMGTVPVQVKDKEKRICKIIMTNGMKVVGPVPVEVMDGVGVPVMVMDLDPVPVGDSVMVLVEGMMVVVMVMIKVGVEVVVVEMVLVMLMERVVGFPVVNGVLGLVGMISI